MTDKIDCPVKGQLSCHGEGTNDQRTPPSPLLLPARPNISETPSHEEDGGDGEEVRRGAPNSGTLFAG